MNEPRTIDDAGWCAQAVQQPSPNFDARPDGVDISLIVIHNISLPPGQFGTGMVEDLFTNQLPIDAHPYFKDLEGLKVSAHFFISREGAITQFVSCKDRAWHAGISEFKKRKNCNDFSLGIELEGVDDQAYSDAQYQSLNQLVNELTKHYPLITPDRICGHSDIAPERKTDPGPAFIWQRLQAKHSGERS